MDRKEQIESRMVTAYMEDLQKMSELIVSCPALDAIESAGISKEKFREFAIQRYKVSEDFELLLETAIQKANKRGDDFLVRTLEKNLNDEQGIDEKGNPLHTGSHKKWREDFYGAMGIDQSALNRDQSTDETIAYRQFLSALIDRGTLEEILGALLVQEYVIPEEFKRIKKGRDLIFPDEFAIQETDSRDVRQAKGRARLYIDHHIAHDATSHYPELLAAVKPYILSKSSEAIKRGMKGMTDVRVLFYVGIQKIFT